MNLEERIKAIADELHTLKPNDPIKAFDSHPLDKTLETQSRHGQHNPQAEEKDPKVQAMQKSSEDNDPCLFQKAIKPEDLCNSDDDWPEPINEPGSASVSLSG